MKKAVSISLMGLLSVVLGWAQNANVAAKLGYPQMIVYNAKIVTVDDASFESRIGTIVQAMAVRDGKILATGSNTEIRALAGPPTRQIDLKGRTIVPGFFMTHEHPTDWAFMDREALRRALPEDNKFMIVRWLMGTAEQQFNDFEGVLKDEAAKAKPGQWVWLSFTWGPNNEYAEGVWENFKNVTRQRLDQIVPDKPVIIKKQWPLELVVNSKALEEIGKVIPNVDPAKLPDRRIEPDVVFNSPGKNGVESLAEVLKAELELWAAQGVTTIGSSTYTYSSYQALSSLDRKGEMPSRFAWGYTGPDFSTPTLHYIAGLLGTGSDHLWNIGAWDGAGGSCSTINASPQVKAAENCAFAPGSPGRESLENIIRAGGRIATMHAGADKDIDYFLDAIVKASREAGMSLEEIRAKRHAFDHAAGAPRPDQIPILKNLGMMVGMTSTLLWEWHLPYYDDVQRVREYGIEYAAWAQPRRSVINGGVMSTFELDRPIPHKLFFMIDKMITRQNDRLNQVLGPAEKSDRFIELKALTRWGSYYVLRENQLGTLEPGKLADFIVLDRDYLTIPENDIPNVTVLMTAVGGRIVHLMPGLAREIGVQSIGPVTWETKPLENYFAR